jgi:hypothetical protein
MTATLPPLTANGPSGRLPATTYLLNRKDPTMGASMTAKGRSGAKYVSCGAKIGRSPYSDKHLLPDALLFRDGDDVLAYP